MCVFQTASSIWAALQPWQTFPVLKIVYQWKGSKQWNLTTLWISLSGACSLSVVLNSLLLLSWVVGGFLLWFAPREKVKERKWGRIVIILQLSGCYIALFLYLSPLPWLSLLPSHLIVQEALNCRVKDSSKLFKVISHVLIRNSHEANNRQSTVKRVLRQCG